MANKTKQGKKKTKKEVQAYKAFVKQDLHDQQDTVSLDNINLRGSDQIDDDIHLPTDKPNIPLSYKLKKFFKKYAFESIIVTLVCGFLAWGGSAIVQMKIDVAVVQTQLDHLKDKVDGLDADATTKEIIDLQIESIKKDLSGSFDLKIASIESQLDLIEQQIEYIEKNSTGNTQ